MTLLNRIVAYASTSGHSAGLPRPSRYVPSDEICVQERALVARLQAVVRAGLQDQERIGQVRAIAAGAIRRMA